MPKGARFYYRFYPNDPLKTAGPYASKRVSQADPFNPKHWLCNDGDPQYSCQSLGRSATLDRAESRGAGRHCGTAPVQERIDGERAADYDLHAARLLVDD